MLTVSLHPLIEAYRELNLGSLIKTKEPSRGFWHVTLENPDL